MRSGTGRRSKAKPRGSTPLLQRGRLKVHDPFELIRWLALSQADSRKAMAELVQNSLDAGATRVEVTRVRLKGTPCLRIWDDGEGVIPELDRPEALKYIATHIGHSRKRSLTPQERLELMTQGQYGIGLLGFWSLGETLELRSCLPGQKAYRLIFTRDRPDYVVEPLRGRLPFDERWTEVVVAGLHREALPALGARRASEYLASELRGQLLAREVDLVVRDRISRGRSLKLVHVRPKRFLGERLQLPERWDMGDQPPLQIELYLVGQDPVAEARGVAVYAAGTRVCESFEDLAPMNLDRAPWTDPRLTGLVDFPALAVAPGSRRGVLLDSGSAAFARAIQEIEPEVTAALAEFDRRRAEELDQALVKDLQRAFKDFYRQRPRYTLLPVERSAGVGPGPVGTGLTGSAADAGEGAAGGEADSDALAPSEPLADASDLFPPGPLAELRISPGSIRVECGGERQVWARAYDASRHKITEDVSFQWQLSGPVGRVESDEQEAGRCRLVAGDRPGEGELEVVAALGDHSARGTAAVEVMEQLPAAGSSEGIPEPELVDQPSASWRSRIVEERWQVNSGHPEYREIADRPSLKLRYLALLFAKEIVLRSSQDPRFEGPLEQLVEVAAYADRKLSERRPGRRRKKAG